MNLMPGRRLEGIATLAILAEVVLFLTLCGASSAQESSVVRPSETASAGKLHAASTSNPDRPELQHRDARYRLCASDVIALTFPLTPEFNQTVNIQPDGFASLMGAGDVRLEGLTTEESVQAIGTAYSKVLRNPMVTVELKDFNKPYFVVGGQVHQPGKYDLRGYTTASQAIAIAGGFNEAAKHSQVLLFRRVNNDWFEVKNLNLKRILRGQEIGEDPEIRTGDMLFVVFNFPPARIFMGDSGSTALGFLLALLTLDFCSVSRMPMRGVAFAVVAAGLPLLDAALAIIRRVRRASSPFAGDRRHFYDLLLARDWPPRTVAFVSYAITFILAATGWLSLRANSLRFMLPGAATLALVFGAALRLGSLRSEKKSVDSTKGRTSAKATTHPTAR